MDFALSEEQQAIVDLATQILTDMCAPERLREVEAGADWFHRDLWSELAKADLLGIALPESVGGGGFGFLEACLLLERQGRSVAPVPLLPTLDRLAGHRRVRLRRPAGRLAARRGRGRDGPDRRPQRDRRRRPRDPQLGAVPERGDWVLSGTKTTVPAVHLAGAVVVPARDPEGDVRLFVVPTDAAGLTIERQDTFNHEPQFHRRLRRRRRRRRGRAGHRRARPTARPPSTGSSTGPSSACAPSPPGVSDAGMRITAGYVGRAQAVRPGDRHVPGRRPPHGRLLRRQRGHPPQHAAGRQPARSRAPRPTRRSRWPSTGRPTAAAGSATPTCTCTAASRSTSTTRSTATSSGPSRSSSSSAPPAPQLARLGAFLADDPVPA